MKRHYLPFVIAILLPFTAAAEGPVGAKIYGKINLTLDRVDEESDLAPLDDVDEWQLNSNASRLGVKGDLALTPGLTAIYQLEWEVKVDGDGDNLTARDQFVGLSGKFGTIVAGKIDTPTKKAQKKIDLFNDLVGDIKNTFEGENRADDIVIYRSPEFGPVSVVLGFIPGEGNSVNGINLDEEGNSDKASGDDIADGISFAAQYSVDIFTVALGIDRDVDGQDLERLVGQVQLGDLFLGGMLQHNENDSGSLDENGFFLSSAYTIGNNVFKAQAGMVENDANDGEEETFSVGYDRKLAKTTKAFTYITRNKDTDALDNEKTDTVFGVGLEHKF